MPTSAAPAVSRAIEVLEFLAGHSAAPVSLTDIARGIGAARSSTRNICSALEDGGLIQRRDGGYQLGRRLVEFGGAYLSSFDQIREFYRACAESPLLSRELVQVAIMDGTDVLYVARHEGRSPLHLSARIGDRFPAALTAVGKALLASLGEPSVRARFGASGDLGPGTARSVRTVDELIRQLGAVRERGYAVDIGEVHPAVVGVAAAVPEVGSAPRFAVGVSLIAARPDDAALERYGKAVRTIAAQIAAPARRIA
ncbi:IclR family transcriptional regulator [Sinomonas sp. ASV322]|uniref:IclR family transcriptional regulator n=1 Tax=Sinomonas sp. ASV322 TaxID=3041920 RepID=UPI0027DD1E0C|nr:IclR family transcriptional regulator [Sinomonas sp. ASV322]MDQ4501195.1 IclR family transcriptional regulator [Sinomonas sp. ASV322]